MKEDALIGWRGRVADVRVDEKDSAALKAGGERRQLAPATDEQSRANKEHDRQRDLNDDQRLAHREPAMTFGNAPPLRLHGRLRIDTSRAPRRREAEEQTGDRRDADREEQHAEI